MEQHKSPSLDWEQDYANPSPFSTYWQFLTQTNTFVIQALNHILWSCPNFDALRFKTWPNLYEAQRKLCFLDTAVDSGMHLIYRI